MTKWINLFILLLFAQCNIGQPTNRHTIPNYLYRLTDSVQYHLLAGAPLSEKYGEVRSLKVVYSQAQDTLYFTNSTAYKFHYDFCYRVLHHRVTLDIFNRNQYSDHTQKKQFLLANINFYKASGIYTLEFFADDKISPAQIEKIYRAVVRNSYLPNTNLRLLNNSLNLAERLQQLPHLPQIQVHQLYETQQFQALNKAKAYGYLPKIPIAQLNAHNVAPLDIVLTEGLPIDFPICQGIITTTFQTPLCHVNILSQNRGTPNAAYKNAWSNTHINSLLNQLVYFEVSADSIILRPASLPAAQKFWSKKHSKRPPIHLQRNLRYKNLIDIAQLDIHDQKIVGTKAANFGELHRVRLPNNDTLHTPEGAFAIPFYYYHQHLQNNHIYPLIDQLYLQSDTLPIQQLERELKNIRQKILKAPLSSNLLHAVTQQIQQNNCGTRYRFRSSTNVEDLQNFNGAGLYDSKSGDLLDPNQPIETAIKKVWASAWNLRAYQERQQFNIDQRRVAMGILCHRAFGTEAANGVAITQHLYRPSYPAFTINLQVGETSIVLPPNDTTHCEETLLTFNRMNTPNTPQIAVEFINKSSIIQPQTVLTPAEYTRLAHQLLAIKKHFYPLLEPNASPENFEQFALDIEFKFDQYTRQLYFKQVRLY